MKIRKSPPKTLLQQLKDLLDGLENKPPGGLTALAVDGEGETIAALILELQKYAAAYQAVVDTDFKHQVALAARTAIEPIVLRRLSAICGALRGALGKRHPDLSFYGITPAKETRSLTVEEDVIRVAKIKATRAARHTMGKRQKLAIKGQVPPKAT